MSILDYIKPVEERAAILLNDFEDVPGLRDVGCGVLALDGCDNYLRLFKASVRGHNVGITSKESAEDLLQFEQIRLASSVLKKPVLFLPPLTDYIISTHFMALVHVLIWRYYNCTHRNLTHQNLEQVITVILERIITQLENFNEKNTSQKPNQEFYQELRKVKWDRRAKKLFSKLDTLRGAIQVDWKKGATDFRSGENFMLEFLAACNVVHHNRNKITTEDVVVAYMTYFKLLKTDISKLGVI